MNFKLLLSTFIVGIFTCISQGNADSAQNKTLAKKKVIYKMKKLKTPIKIDGEMETNLWSNVPWTESFYYLDSSEKSKIQTKFKLAYDDEFLYFFIINQEPNMNKISKEVTKRDGAVWRDDCNEIFICPYGEKGDYYQFIINSNGAYYDTKHANKIPNKNWNTQAEIKSKRFKNSWNVEGKIAIKDLLLKDKKTMSFWSFNISRTRIQSGQEEKKKQHQSWSIIGDVSFNTPSFFNVLSGFDAPFVIKHPNPDTKDDFHDLFLQDQVLQVFFPREKIYIANNVAAPNFVQIKDSRSDLASFLIRAKVKMRTSQAYYEYLDNLHINIRLPKGFSLYNEKETAYTTAYSIKKIDDYYQFTPQRKRAERKFHIQTPPTYTTFPLYIKTNKPANTKGNIEIWVEQKTKRENIKTKVLKYPFTVIKMPKARQLKDFVVNIWPNQYIFYEPEHVKTRKKMGFNSISPALKFIEKNNGNKEIENFILNLIKEARTEKMKIVAHDSTFGRFKWSKEGRWGKTKHMDPTYTGPAYQKDLNALKRIDTLFNPDYLFIDSEFFRELFHDKKAFYSWEEGIERIKKSGLPLKDYLTKLGNRACKDVEKSLNCRRKKQDIKRVQYGFYGMGTWLAREEFRFPSNELFDGIFNVYEIEKSNTMDFAQPQVYHTGDMELVVNVFEAVRKAVPAKKILPWVGPGYPSPMPAVKIRDQFLEVAAFGCKGIAYWGEHTFDVGGYVQHINAINEIAPYEDILVKGETFYQKKTNYEFSHIKGVKKAKEAVILFSCYKRSKAITENIKNPLKEDCSVFDASNGKFLGKVRAGESISVTLDKTRNTKLIYFGNHFKNRK